MTSMCLYGTLYALLPAVFVVLFRSCLSVKTSKACYGVQGPYCTKHTLVCSSGMIAIQDAYYTNSTACSAGVSSCYFNVSTIPDTGRYQDFSDTQLNNLYTKCSARQRCTLNSVRNIRITFSIVKFDCINDVYNACGHVEATTSGASILWKRNNRQHEDNTCTCTISALKSNTYLSLTALDMRLKNTRQLCPGVTITVDGNSLPINCSQLSPYQLLVNTSQQVQVTVNKGEIDVTILWIRIRGNNTVKVICDKKLTTTTDIVSITLSNQSIKESPSTTPYTSTVESTPTTVTEGSDANGTNSPQNNIKNYRGSSNTATVVGIVIPCLLIIVAILLIAVFIIRRKKAETTKKDDKTNPNTKSQEQYSLARDVHQNEYFEIEKSPIKMAKTDYDNAGFVNTNGNPSSKNHEVYSLAGVAHSNEYVETEPTAPQNSLMAYDYAELSNTHASTSQNEENFGPTNIQVQEDDYDHVGGKPVIQNGHYDTTASVAKTLSKSNSSDKKGDVYSYDHLNDKTTTDNANNDYNVAGRPSDYNATASVQKRFDHATECREDDYGYNHLGNEVQKKTLQNDYDTSASAATAVARLNSRTDDPEYDHVTQDTGVESVPSSRDTPENNEDDSDVYTLARKGDNPYQLAK